MGRKPVASEGLRYLMERGVEVAFVVAPPKREVQNYDDRLVDTAEHFGLPTGTMMDLYHSIKGGFISSDKIDHVFSVLHSLRIPDELLAIARKGAINWHPAPLPDYRGVGGYNFAILDGLTQWGVTAHYMDSDIDTGDIIRVRRFDIEARNETAWSLEQTTQRHLWWLFKDVVDDLIAGQPLPRSPQGQGRYIGKGEFEAAKLVKPGDDVERKVRAFWYPPWPGAKVEHDGKVYTLVNDDIMRDVARRYRR